MARLVNNWADFYKAKKFFRKLNIKNHTHYRKIDKSKFPHDIPRSPFKVYSNHIDWKGFADFCGFKQRAYGNYISYKQAQRFVKKLKLKTVDDWIKYRKSGKKPIDIPTHPNIIYKDNGWVNWRIFLTGKPTYMGFEKARKIVRRKKIPSSRHYKKMFEQKKLPKGLPKSPEFVYKAKKRPQYQEDES